MNKVYWIWESEDHKHEAHQTAQASLENAIREYLDTYHLPSGGESFNINVVQSGDLYDDVEQKRYTVKSRIAFDIEPIDSAKWTDGN